MSNSGNGYDGAYGAAAAYGGGPAGYGNYSAGGSGQPYYTSPPPAQQQQQQQQQPPYQGAGSAPYPSPPEPSTAYPAAQGSGYGYGSYGAYGAAAGSPLPANAPHRPAQQQQQQQRPDAYQQYPPQQQSSAPPPPSSAYAPPQVGHAQPGPQAPPPRQGWEESPAGARGSYDDYPQQQHQQQHQRGWGEAAAPEPRRPRRVPDRFIDIASSPSPVRDIPYTSTPARVSNGDPVKPLSAVDFIGIDDGNANPKFFRLSLDSVPFDPSHVQDTCLPMGAAVAPLCRPLHEEEEVPVVSERPPIRCHRCRGYLSCHARFIDGGQRWVCPLCEMPNDVAPDFFANLDAKGRRVDYAEKAELCCGSVEYNVDEFPEYRLRNDKGDDLPTRPLHHLFFVDVSSRALRTFLPAYIEALEESITRMAELTPQCKVSFVTYASQLHFYNFRDPRMPQYIVADVANPFVPLPFSALCWLEVGPDIGIIREFLSRVMSIATDLGESGCAVGAAVQIAMLVFAGQHGGRAIIALDHHPEAGIGAITLREQHKLYGTKQGKELLRPIDGFWTTTATEAARQQISFDLFAFPGEYCELVTMSQVSHVTNGSVFLFPNYDPEVDGTKVKALMGRVTTEEAGYAGILRVRCSNGLKVKKYHGHYLSQTPNDMDLASVSGSSIFYVELAHEGSLEKNSYVHFQIALLYTTRGGSRRVRVHSTRAITTPGISKTYHGCDLEAVLLGILHEAVSFAVNKGPQEVDAMLMKRVTDILVNYRRYSSVKSARSAKTLLLPGRLRLLPIFAMCLGKSDALSSGTTVRIDERVHSLYELMSMPMHKLCSYLYPSLFALHRLTGDPSYGLLNPETKVCILPPHEQLLFNTICCDGVYALCDEQALVVYVWIGSIVQPAVSEALFGTPDATTVCRPGGPGTESFSDALQNVLYALTLRDDGMRRLVVVHEGERAEDAFFKQLKEEGADGAVSYDVYLTKVHRTVAAALQ